HRSRHPLNFLSALHHRFTARELRTVSRHTAEEAQMAKASKQSIWFITGSSRGLGLEIAREALRRGDAVVATARDADAVTRALGSHESLLPLALDVANERQAREAAAAAVARFRRIDVLVNNAGRGLLGAVEEASAEEVRSVFSVNVDGLLTVTR